MRINKKAMEMLTIVGWVIAIVILLVTVGILVRNYRNVENLDVCPGDCVNASIGCSMDSFGNKQTEYKKTCPEQGQICCASFKQIADGKKSQNEPITQTSTSNIPFSIQIRKGEYPDDIGGETQLLPYNVLVEYSIWAVGSSEDYLCFIQLLDPITGKDAEGLEKTGFPDDAVSCKSIEKALKIGLLSKIESGPRKDYELIINVYSNNLNNYVASRVINFVIVP